MSATAPFRYTEPPASPRTRCWPGCTAGIGPCGSSTGRTRGTCGRSHASRLAGKNPPWPRRSPDMAAAVRELSGAWNFRDVSESIGGAAPLRPGRLCRSSELSRLDDDGRETLRRLGITDVADLRASREVARRGPGQVPDGIEIHLLPFPDLGDQQGDDEPSDGEAPHEHAFRKLMTERPEGESINEAAVRHMTDEYRQFPTRNGAQRALR